MALHVVVLSVGLLSEAQNVALVVIPNAALIEVLKEALVVIPSEALVVAPSEALVVAPSEAPVVIPNAALHVVPRVLFVLEFRAAPAPSPVLVVPCEGKESQSVAGPWSVSQLRPACWAALIGLEALRVAIELE